MNDTDAEAPVPDATAELHALVDGQLPPDRVASVLAHLRSHPEDAVRVAEWQAERLALRQWHRGTELGPVPAAMQLLLKPPRTRRHTVWQAVAAVLLLGLGGLLGAHWAGPGLAAPAVAEAPPFVREAAFAHALFIPEARHPVEVSAADEAHLVAWLSRRLGAPLTVPKLAEQGFRLLGGRLLPGESGSPSAQFMYEDSAGRRLTLYVTRQSSASGETAPEVSFRTVRDGDLESFYWIESGFGYALAAQLPPGDVMALARAVYRQLARE